jgi:hypothetical protein
MIGVRIPIALALCRLVSNGIGGENQADKLGEKRQKAGTFADRDHDGHIQPYHAGDAEASGGENRPDFGG